MRQIAQRAFFFVAVALLVGCDHATKSAARGALFGGHAITLLRGWLELRYAENFDTAFSLTHSWSVPWKGLTLTVLGILTTVLVLVVVWQRRIHLSRAHTIACAFLVAGASGNTLDRLQRGYVIDFIYVHHWPIFNVADVLVVAGLALLARRSHVLLRA